MKEKTAILLADAFEEALEVNKLSATEIFETLLGAKVSARERKWARVGYQAGLRKMLKTMPEPSKKQLREILTLMTAFKSAPQRMRALLKQTIKELPHAPGGPPRKLTLDQERTACAQVVALRGELGNREAIHRVALRKGVSDRTMYRIWRKHHPKEKKL